MIRHYGVPVFACVVMLVARIVAADVRTTSPLAALWNNATNCARCDEADRVDSLSFNAPPDGAPLFTNATGNVTIKFTSWSDMTGSGAFLHLYIGPDRITPSLSGVVSGAPANGDFFKTGGGFGCSCCTGVNVATFTVTDAFFNSHLVSGRLPITISIPGGSSVNCVAASCNVCASGTVHLDGGFQSIQVTWCPSTSCDDGEPCTSDLCDTTGTCTHASAPAGTSCNDGDFCNGVDTCTNGICVSSGNPCPGADGDFDCSESCNENTNSCTANDPDGSSCNDGQFCTLTDTCSNGDCLGSGDRCSGATPACCETTDACVAECCSNADCDDHLACNGVETCAAGACVDGTPLVEPVEPDTSVHVKNRFLSFSVPAEGSTAIQVDLIELQNPNPANPPCCPPQNFGAYESASCTAAGEGGSCARWVGPSAMFKESQDNAALGSFRGARLQCSPYYHDWSGEGVIHVAGAEIMPSSSYEVKTFAASCLGNEATFARMSPVR